MALTSRDVMFVMRSQDFASRGVMRLGGAFNKLQRELVAIDETLNRRLNRSQEQQTRALEQSQAALRRGIQPLQEHNRALSTRNAEISKEIHEIRSARSARAEQLRQNQSQVRTAQEQIRTLQARRQALLNENDAMRAGTTATREQLRENANLRGQITRNIGKWEKQIATHKENREAIRSQHVPKRESIRLLQEEQKANSLAAAQNREAMGARRDASQAEQRAIRARAQAQQQQARQEADLARQRIQRIQSQIQRTQAAGVAAMMMGAVLLAAGAKGVQAFTDMTMAAAEFQYEMALASTQVDEAIHGNNITIDELRRSALQTAREVPAGMETMGKTLFFIFSSTNATLEDSKQLLRGFAREAVAGNTDIEAAARSTIAIMNAMGLEFTELERIQDMQFQTVRKGVITYEELSKNIGKLLPALQRSGQEIETGGAMLAFLTRQGLSAEMAATSAARALELIADPRVVGRLERLGVTVRDDVTGEFLPLVDMLQQITDVLGDAPAPERAERLLEVFGGAGYRIQARRFFDTVLPNFEQFKQHIEWQIDNAGSLDRAYGIMFDEPINQIELLSNKWEALRLTIGEAFFPVIEEVIRLLDNLMEWWENLTEVQRNNIVQWTAIAAVVATVGGALLLFGGIITTVAAMLTVMTGSWAATLSIMGGAPIVIMAIVGALAYALLNFDSLTDAISRFIEWLGITEDQAALILVVLGGVSTALLIANTNALLAAGGLGTLRVALTAIATHPVILILGTLAALIYTLGARGREVNRIASEMANEFNKVEAAITGSVEGFENYEKILGDATKATAEQVLKEKDLYNILHENANLNANEVMDGILGSNREREKQLDLIEQEISAAEEASGFWQTFWRGAGALGETSERGWRFFGEDEVVRLRRLRNALTDVGDAAQQARRELINEWKSEGGVNAEIAKYIELLDRGTRQSEIAAQHQREHILTILEGVEAWSDLDRETQEALIHLGIHEGNLEEFNDTMSKTNELVQALTSTFERLGSAQAGWDRGLEVANERIQEHNDALESGSDAMLDAVTSLHELDDGLDLWIQGLQEGEAESRSVFTNMASLIQTHGDDMIGHSELVMSTILSMGEAGPEAMQMLAEASPEDFLEVLRQIRLQAALTSEEVQEHMETMMVGFEAIMQEHKDFPPEIMGEIMMGMVQIVADHEELTEDQVGFLMQAIGDTIGAYEDVTASQMLQVLELLIHIMSTGGEEAAREFMIGLRSHEGELESFVSYWNSRLRFVIDVDMSALGRALAHTRSTGQAIADHDFATFGGNSGGLIPGGGPDRDSVLAAVTPGEYVIRRKAVDAVGTDFLDAVNAQQRNAGGIIRGQALNAGGAVSGRFRTGVSAPMLGGGIPSGLEDEDIERLKEEIRLNQEAMRVREMSFLQHIDYLTRKMSEEVKYSNEWLSLMDERQSVIESLDSFIDQSARDRAQIENNMFQLGVIGHQEYLEILDLRIAKEEEFTNEWTSLVNQRIDLMQEEATASWNASKAFVDAQMNKIQADQKVQQLQDELAQMRSGPTAQQQLEVLRAEERVANLQATVARGRDTDQFQRAKENFDAAQVTLQEAKAQLAYAQFDAARLDRIADSMEAQDEVTALLMRFQGEHGIAEASKAVGDAQEEMNNYSQEMKDSKLSTRELKIAQLELQIATESLDEAKKGLTVTSDDLLMKQLEIIRAEMDQAEATYNLITASADLSETFDGQATTVGELLDNVMKLTDGYLDLRQAMDSIGSGASGGGSTTATTASRVRGLFDEYGVSLSQGAMPGESGSQRIARITDEVMSGERTIADVERSINRLAGLQRGGVITRQGLVRVGERGPEILDLNRGAMVRPLSPTDKGGSTVTIERGAVQLKFNGPIDSASIGDVQDYVDKTFEELIERLRSD